VRSSDDGNKLNTYNSRASEIVLVPELICDLLHFKKILNSSNACNHSVQNLLSSCLLSNSVKMRIHIAIIFPVVLCGCETWFLTSREEHRLRVFETKVLRRRLGPKRDEVTGGWRKLHNEELHNLCSFPSIIRMIKSTMVRWQGM
jgi:hypothetical protein